MLTTSEILAAATETLHGNGYSPVSSETGEDQAGWRCFEDPYGIVGLAVFETWTDLANSWVDRQAELVELISSHVSDDDAKAWDGYLVLLTPSTTPESALEQSESIRYNVSRVRKLLATAPELETIGDVERVLLPLLPLPDDQVATVGTSALERIAEVLVDEGADPETVMILLGAFRRDEPLVEALHEQRGNS